MRPSLSPSLAGERSPMAERARFEPCACGGRIVVVLVDGQAPIGAIESAIGAHAETPQHRAWSTSIETVSTPAPAPAIARRLTWPEAHELAPTGREFSRRRDSGELR